MNKSLFILVALIAFVVAQSPSTTPTPFYNPFATPTATSTPGFASTTAPAATTSAPASTATPTATHVSSTTVVATKTAVSSATHIPATPSSIPTPTASISPSPVANPLVWQGTWENNAFGGYLYLCVNGSSVSGTFSNVGYVMGEVSRDARVVTGKWAYAGYTDFSSGNFTWNLSYDGNAFTGFYTYDVDNGQDFPCIINSWSPAPDRWDDRITNFVNSSFCIPIAPEGNNITSGTYQEIGSSGQTLSSGIDLCVDYVNNKYYGSYTLGNTQGYMAGNILANGRVLQGTSYSGSNGTSINLFILGVNGTLTNLYVDGISSAQELTTTQAFGNTTISYNYGSSVTKDVCLTQRSLFPTWSGAFDDVDFGYGRTYMCTDGTNVWGVYSQVGFFNGIITANVTSGLSSVTGVFYDSGDVTFGGKGNFTLVMSQDGNLFSGSWVFDNENITYPWNALRISSNAASNYQCGTLSSSTADLQGTWVYNISDTDSIALSLCFNDAYSRYEYSYSTTESNQQGYGKGWIENNGKSLRGQWYTFTAEGIEYWLSLGDGSVAQNSYWPFTNLQDVQFLPCDGDEVNGWFNLHQVLSYSLSAVPASNSDCERNQYLYVPHPNPSVLPSGSITPRPSRSPLPEYTSYGSASSLVLSVVSMLFVALVLFF